MARIRLRPTGSGQAGAGGRRPGWPPRQEHGGDDPRAPVAVGGDRDEEPGDADAGWACITWPAEHGGRGGTAAQAAIFAEECARIGGAVNAFAVGIAMAGPTIIAHGTEAQQARFLPPLARGDEVWCQLFSEPGAGSDLAGLSTRAERDGDEWVVNGQKVWTSGAHYSDWGILAT